MKITLSTDEKDITLDDEGFDVPGWVNICIDGKCIEIHISELYSAIVGLNTHYLEDHRHDIC
jgi:hypothetical protein